MRNEKISETYHTLALKGVSKFISNMSFEKRLQSKTCKETQIVILQYFCETLSLEKSLSEQLTKEA